MSFNIMLRLNGDSKIWAQAFGDIQRSGGLIAGQPDSWTTGIVRPFHQGDTTTLLETIRREFDNDSDIADFEGEYAVMYCSSARNKVILACDWSGSRRLYYFVEDGNLAVGSNIYDLLKMKRERRFSIHSCYEFLAYEFVTDPGTLFEGIFTVPHGCQIHIDAHGNISFKETRIRLAETDESHSPDMCHELRRKIVAAHARRVTKSNGIYLSGGIDSSVMAICLKKDLGIEDVTAFTFSTQNATQDESDHAKSVAHQLGLRFEKVTVNPDEAIDLEDLVGRANFPYPGMIMLSKLAATVGACNLTGINLFAGQDTRLHTPGYNLLDRMVLCTLLNLPSCRSALSGTSRLLKRWPIKGKLKRAACRLSSAEDLASYLTDNFFHRHAASPLNERPFSRQYASNFRQAINERLSAPLTARKIFNQIVDNAWDRQYTDDMAYMIGITESYGNYCAMPFYDRELAAFAASLPMRPALKRTRGRAGHGSKSKRVNKYLLRKAFAHELTDDLVYRDKAVCVTGFNYLNGTLSRYISEYFPTPRLRGGELDTILGLSMLFDRGLRKNRKWQMSDYNEVVETHNLLFLEQIARTYNVAS